MRNLGVDYYAVASTSQCVDDYAKVLYDIRELIRLDKDKVMPIMWITPDSLSGNIEWYLESEIEWKMLKIHPYLNQSEWKPGSKLLDEVLEISQCLNLPLLIHTGYGNCCCSELYESTISNNPNCKFILAHGRPIESAIRMARDIENAYVDTAFMPMEDIKRFINLKLCDKLLWGSDMPIQQYYDPSLNIQEYYKIRLSSLKQICTDDEFSKITYTNSQLLLN